MQEFDASLSIGTSVSKYRIQSVLGAGGFGITYKAEDTVMHRAVALKEFLPQDLAARTHGDTKVIPKTNCSSDYQYGLNKFLDEARTLARFDHNNIVRVYDVVEENGTAYLAMQYAEGQALDDHLKQIHFAGNMTESRIREIIEPVLQGLAVVHNTGLLHRDIKPGNIYLKQDNEPMLIDFGAARQSVGEKSKSMSAIVSDGYAPPEQYSSRSRQGAWTDLYAIGAVLYHLVVGEKPESSIHRKNEIDEDEIDPLKPLPTSGYSAELLQTISYCLTLKAKERPQSVAEIQALLNPTQAVIDNPQIDETIRIKRDTKQQEAFNQQSNDSTRKVSKSNVEEKQSAEESVQQAGVLEKKGSFVKTATALFVIAAFAGGGYYAFDQYQSEQALKKQAEFTKKQVLRAQGLLKQLGYELRRSGIKDATTAQQIRLFEEHNNFKQTGEVSQTLIDRLKEAIVAKKDKDAWNIAKNENTEAGYSRYLRDFPDGNYRSQAEDGKEFLHNLALKRPLYIETFPTNATIRILNIVPRYVPGMLLDPGTYNIEIAAPGYKTIERDVMLTEQSNRFNFELEAELTVGTVYITTRPTDAEVKVVSFNGKAFDKVIELGDQLEFGDYLFSISAPGYKSQQVDYVVEKGKDLTRVVRLEPQPVAKEQNSSFDPAGLLNATANEPNPSYVTPIVRVEPRYPTQAARDGKEGWVQLSFTVNELGGVEDIEVIDSEPVRIFDREARKALAKWKYRPKIVNGKPVKQTGLTVQLDFNL